MLISTQHKVQLMLVGMSVIPQAFVHNLKQTYSAERLWGKNGPRTTLFRFICGVN